MKLRESQIENIAMRCTQQHTTDGVLDILQGAGLDGENHWRTFGRTASNISVISNQQSDPIKSLVELLTNSRDSIFEKACRDKGIDPTSQMAPQSIYEAAQEFFGITDGDLSSIDADKRKKLSKNVNVVASGSRDRPCITVVDTGGGQGPQSVADTVLSLLQSNKQRIQFVGGKFGQGGSGFICFCNRGCQIILAKKPDEDDFAFTVILLRDPDLGERNPVVEYLTDEAGKILSFPADSLPLLPAGEKEFGEPLAHGLFRKSMEVSLPTKTSLILDTKNKLDAIMVKPAFPINLVDCRGFGAKNNDARLLGLKHKLTVDRSNNMEAESPILMKCTPAGLPEITIEAHVYKTDEDAQKAKRRVSNKNSSSKFTLDGMAQGHRPAATFYGNMSYIGENVVTLVELDTLSSMDLHNVLMADRERLRESETTKAIMEAVKNTIKDNPVLRALDNAQRNSVINSKIKNDNLGQQLYKKVMSKVRDARNMMQAGTGMNCIIKNASAVASHPLRLRKTPTFHTPKKKLAESKRKVEIDRNARLKFLTDAVDDYICRPDDPGVTKVTVSGLPGHFGWHETLARGVHIITLDLGSGLQPGDEFSVEVEIKDAVNTFNHTIDCEAVPKVCRPGGNSTQTPNKIGTKPGKGAQAVNDLNAPNIIPVGRADWGMWGMDRNSAMTYRKSAGGYDFYFNKDNAALLVEKKHRPALSAVLEQQFANSLVVMAISILSHKDLARNDPQDNVEKFTAAVAPTILPTLAILGSL